MSWASCPASRMASMTVVAQANSPAPRPTMHMEWREGKMKDAGPGRIALGE